MANGSGVGWEALPPRDRGVVLVLWPRRRHTRVHGALTVPSRVPSTLELDARSHVPVIAAVRHPTKRGTVC